MNLIALDIDLFMDGQSFEQVPFDEDSISDPIESMLHEYGHQIISISRRMLSYVVATGTPLDSIEKSDYAMYIVAPAINKSYRMITIEVLNIEKVSVKYFSYTGQLDRRGPWEERIGNDLDMRIGTILQSPLAITTFKHLIALSSLRD